MGGLTHEAGTAGAISLRTHNIGGTVSEVAQICPDNLFEHEGRLIILVHGFNVAKDEADRSYKLFERRLSKNTRAAVVRLYWPGDASTRADRTRERKSFFSRLLSGGSYPLQPERADDVAQKIRNLIHGKINDRKSGTPLEVVIVAHSLGCYLTLLLLDRILILEGNKLHFRLVTLMAAAVPQYAAQDGRLRSLFAGLKRLWILHSAHDRVLRWLFPVGQFFERPAFSGWRLSTRGAIGLHGFHRSERISVVKGEWDHSEYWGDEYIGEALEHELGGTRPNAFETLSRRVSERIVEARRVERRQMAPLAMFQ